jgi:ankyrin repeat protein
MACSPTGHLELVRLLVVEFGADVDQPQQSGTTPLMVAVQASQLDVVRLLLLECGADVNRSDRNGDGNTPLMCVFRTRFMIGSVALGFKCSQSASVWLCLLRCVHCRNLSLLLLV